MSAQCTRARCFCRHPRLPEPRSSADIGNPRTCPRRSSEPSGAEPSEVHQADAQLPREVASGMDTEHSAEQRVKPHIGMSVAFGKMIDSSAAHFSNAPSPIEVTRGIEAETKRGQFRKALDPRFVASGTRTDLGMSFGLSRISSLRGGAPASVSACSQCATFAGASTLARLRQSRRRNAP